MTRSHFLVCLLFVLTPVASADDPRTIDGWGTVVDPKQDCGFAAGNGSLTVTVPATLHDLNPRNGALSAPRVLQKVRGDFAVKVRVACQLQPGRTSTAPRSLPFQSAGLLIWGDEKNYVRLERNAWFSRIGNRCYAPLLEVFAGGKMLPTQQRSTSTDYFSTAATTLVLVREDGWISAHVSHDGKEWEVIKNVRAALPDTVYVGVAAVNTSDGPLSATFDQLEIRPSNKP